MAKKIERDKRNSVRIGPRISRSVYQLAKYVYSAKGVNFEDQVEELLIKDLDYQMKQKWFINAIAGKEGENFIKLKTVLDAAQSGDNLDAANNKNGGNDE